MRSPTVSTTVSNTAVCCCRTNLSSALPVPSAEDARALVIERWLVLYRLVEDGVQVVRIIDGARDLTRIDWNPKDARREGTGT
jgi:hypothetical protein